VATGLLRHINDGDCYELHTTDSAKRLGFIKCACGHLHTKFGTTRHLKNCIAGRAAATKAAIEDDQADRPDDLYFREENDDEGPEDRENVNENAAAAARANNQRRAARQPPPVFPFAYHLEPEHLQHVPYLSDEELAKYLGNDSGSAITFRWYLLLHQLSNPDPNTHKRIRQIMSEAANHLAQKFLDTNDRTQLDELLFRFLCLPKVGWARSAADAQERCNIVTSGDVRSLLLRLVDKRSKRHVPSSAAGDATLDLNPNEVNLTLKHVSGRAIRKAGQVVAGPRASAQLTQAVVDEMKAKHPVGRANPCGNDAGPLPPRLRADEIGQMLDLVTQQMDLQTAPGIDGMDPYVFKSFLVRSNDRHPTYFRSMLVKLVLTASNDTVVGGAMLRTSRSTPIEQGPKVRPIACGTLLVRVISKVFLKLVPHTEALLPNQFGVGNKGGCETPIAMMQRVYEDHLRRSLISSSSTKATSSAAASAFDAHAHQRTQPVREEDLDDDGNPHGSEPASTRSSRRLTPLPLREQLEVAMKDLKALEANTATRPRLARQAKSASVSMAPQVSANDGDPDRSEESDASPTSKVSDNVRTPPVKPSDTFIVLMDLKNAFNSADRFATTRAIYQHCPKAYRFWKFGYNTASMLIMGYGDETHYLSSSQGLRQGDPCGPLYFSVLIRTLLPELLVDTEAELMSAYLDDIWLATKNRNVLDVLKAAFPAKNSPTGLVLHEDKTRVLSLNELAEGKIGCEMLGSFIGSLELRRKFLNTKIDALNLPLSRLRSLPFHHQFILLRDSISKKVLHLLRCMDTTGLDSELRRIDATLWQVLSDIQDVQFDFEVNEKAAILNHLPRKLGGFGVTSHLFIRDAAREACMSSALQQLRTVFPGDRRFCEGPPNAQPTFEDDLASANPIADLPTQKELVSKVNEDLLARYVAGFPTRIGIFTADCASNTGTAWQQAVPRGQHRYLNDQQMREIIRARNLVGPTHNSDTCAGCGQVQRFGHEDSCQSNPYRTRIKTSSHDYIRDILLKAARDAGRRAEAEPVLSVRNNQDQNAVFQNNLQRRADIKIFMANSDTVLDPRFGLVDLKTSGVLTNHTDELTRTAFDAPLDPTRTDKHPENLRRGWNAIAAVLESTVHKSNTHYQKLNLEHPVVPIVISSGGTLHKTLHKFLKHLGMGQGNLYSETIIDISVALARRRAELRLACQA